MQAFVDRRGLNVLTEMLIDGRSETIQAEAASASPTSCSPQQINLSASRIICAYEACSMSHALICRTLGCVAALPLHYIIRASAVRPDT